MGMNWLWCLIGIHTPVKKYKIQLEYPFLDLPCPEYIVCAHCGLILRVTRQQLLKDIKW